ncbi:MAG: peptidoglycan DD-metalloendopeptidase family protein [Chloroflexota bacterium]
MRHGWLWSLWGLILLAACQPTTSVAVGNEAGVGNEDCVGVETAVSTPEPTNPPLIATIPPPTATPFQIAIATPIPTITHPPPTSTPPPTSDSPTITPTPQPTFTLPALPFTDPNEHYWLRRPVPEGGVVWTDKVYPYGSTRGGTLQTHHGVEFYVPVNTSILAAASGTVRIAGDDATFAQGPTTNFYGNVVVIELDSRLNGQPVYNLYGHLAEIFVNEGQHVEAEEIIAYSGASGIAEGPHLHFEVRVGQNSYSNTRNPSLWLYPFRDRGTVAGRILWPNGESVREALVTLNRVDATSAYAGSTTYADDSVNGDTGWDENFVIDDVEAGFYTVTVHGDDKKYTEELWVYPFRTSFVEITIGGG